MYAYIRQYWAYSYLYSFSSCSHTRTGISCFSLAVSLSHLVLRIWMRKAAFKRDMVGYVAQQYMYARMCVYPMANVCLWVGFVCLRVRERESVSFIFGIWLSSRAAAWNILHHNGLVECTIRSFQVTFSRSIESDASFFQRVILIGFQSKNENNTNSGFFHVYIGNEGK